MQGSKRDFFISNVENIPQNKTIMWCVVKNNENQRHSADRKRSAMGKKAYMNTQALELFGVDKNKLVYNDAKLE